MDGALVSALIDRDWEPFLRQLRVLDLGEPMRSGLRIDLPVVPQGTDDQFIVVLQCDRYDAQAPLLDFADPNQPEVLGAAHWPRLANAPMNSVTIADRAVPIFCVPGTLGYHLHPSHLNETFEKETWRLPAVATLLHRVLRSMGTCVGRGV